MTATITNLSDRRQNDRPDAAHVSQDQWGRPMYQFVGTYQHLGRTWSLPFWAFDADDAEEIAKARGLSDVGQMISEGEW